MINLKKHRSVIHSILLCFTLCPSNLPAQELSTESTTAESEPLLVETFTLPKRTHIKNPKYPRNQQIRGQEGWVRLNYMVSPEGKPYDITVVNSSNDADFEKAAIRSVKSAIYEPAKLNGEPIDAGTGVFITFALATEHPGARQSFGLIYKRLVKFLQADELVRAEKELIKLEKRDRNLYEEAYYHLAYVSVLQKQGASPQNLYDAVVRASAMDRGRGYLPDSVLTGILTTRLGLEVQLNKLANARATAKTLSGRENVPDEHTAYVQRVIEKVEQMQISGEAFTLTDVIRQDNHSVQRLLHNRFHLSNTEGDIAEVRLHCDRGYVGFIHKPDTVYTVRDDWQDCKAILIGTPGTTYTLIQGNF